jgi:hypothetical protein
VTEFCRTNYIVACSLSQGLATVPLYIPDRTVHPKVSAGRAGTLIKVTSETSRINSNFSL